MLAGTNRCIVVGICPCHKHPQRYTAIWRATTTTYSDGASRVNRNSIAISSCGHVVKPLTCSSNTYINGSQAHRVGDLAINCGKGITKAMGDMNISSY